MQKLPIDSYLDHIAEVIHYNQRVILTATPGAGKTTRLPGYLAQQIKGQILVLQPRRLAAVAAAYRLSEEYGEAIGQRVGYHVRGEQKSSSRTKLLFMTDALLLRKMINDPELQGVELVIIDEFHERNINQDLILGLIKELQDMGSPIRLLVMSATLNTKSLEEFLPNVRTIDVPGVVYPLEIIHSSQSFSIKTDYHFIARVVSTIEEFYSKTDGDLLIFLPGLSEINRVSKSLKNSHASWEIFELHGSLSLEKQNEVLKQHSQKRIILSTNIAEASVTVPGVRCVIDTGLSRQSEFSMQTGFEQLRLGRISQFNARQRAGRAAREGAGTCVRLWMLHENTAMDQELEPEVLRCDLVPSFLQLFTMGVRPDEGFSWYTSPVVSTVGYAMKTLNKLGAIDHDFRVTEFGKELIRFPVHPRWSAFLLKLEGTSEAETACAWVATVSERDFFLGQPHLQKELTNDLSPRSDFLLGRRGDTPIHQGRFRRVQESYIQLRKLLNESKTGNILKISDEQMLVFLLDTQLDRLCKRRDNSHKAVMATGRGVEIPETSLASRSPYFIALNGINQEKNSETQIEWAVGLSTNFVKNYAKDHAHHVLDITYDYENNEFIEKKSIKFFEIEIESQSKKIKTVESWEEKHVNSIIKHWLHLRRNNKSLDEWLFRWESFEKNQNIEESFFDRKKIQDILKMATMGQNNLSILTSSTLVQFFEMQLPIGLLKKMNELAPPLFHAPSGRSVAILYSQQEPPFVQIKLQELFGLTQHPMVLNQPLTIKLLSPAGRPVQVTNDILGFWKGSYQDIRKELRGRYPKHPWPENPLTAPATHRTKKTLNAKN